MRASLETGSSPVHTGAVFTLILSLAVFTGAMPADARSPRFEQDRFAIGFWVDPPVNEQAEARYVEIADAGFNLVLALFGARTPDQQARTLELCADNGLKAILAAPGHAPGAARRRTGLLGLLPARRAGGRRFSGAGRARRRSARRAALEAGVHQPLPRICHAGADGGRDLHRSVPRNGAWHRTRSEAVFRGPAGAAPTRT